MKWARNGRLIEIEEVLFCWNDLCENEAAWVYHADGDDYPLCECCAAVFDLASMFGGDVHALPVKQFLEEALYNADRPEDLPEFVEWWEEN